MMRGLEAVEGGDHEHHHQCISPSSNLTSSSPTAGRPDVSASSSICIQTPSSSNSMIMINNIATNYNIQPSNSMSSSDVSNFMGNINLYQQPQHQHHFIGNSQQEHPAPIPLPPKKKRCLPGNSDPNAEVIALSPKSLLATNRFVCEVCNKGFQRDQNLQLHRRGHNLPWKLKQRPKDQPIRRKVYLCPEPTCAHHDPSKALGDLTGIKKHFFRKHGDKRWKCEKCPKRYAVQSDLKAHSKVCGTKEYRCDCGTLFSRRDSFITHRAFCDAIVAERNNQPSSLLPPQPQPLVGGGTTNPSPSLSTTLPLRSFIKNEITNYQHQQQSFGTNNMIMSNLPPWLSCLPQPQPQPHYSLQTTALDHHQENNPSNPNSIHFHGLNSSFLSGANEFSSSAHHRYHQDQVLSRISATTVPQPQRTVETRKAAINNSQHNIPTSSAINNNSILFSSNSSAPPNFNEMIMSYNDKAHLNQLASHESAPIGKITSGQQHIAPSAGAGTTSSSSAIFSYTRDNHRHFQQQLQQCDTSNTLAYYSHDNSNTNNKKNILQQGGSGSGLIMNDMMMINSFSSSSISSSSSPSSSSLLAGFEDALTRDFLGLRSFSQKELLNMARAGINSTQHSDEQDFPYDQDATTTNIKINDTSTSNWQDHNN